MAMLLRGWSDDVVLLTGGSGGLAAGQLARLSVAGIAVDDREVMALTSVQGEPSGQGQLSAVVFADGSRLPRRGLLVAVTLHQLCGLATQLGVAFDTAGPVSEQAVEVDALFRTSVSGVFAAGDVCTQMPQMPQMPQMAAAIAAGSAAAASVIASVLEED